MKDNEDLQFAICDRRFYSGTMTSTPVRRLLDAKPFVSFTLHVGTQLEFSIDDPRRCRLDDPEAILYLSRPRVRPPKLFQQRGLIEPPTVEIIDLRHVRTITVNAAAIPNLNNRKSAIANRK